MMSASTVTVQVACADGLERDVTTTVVVPTAFAVTFPSSSTVAIASSNISHFTDLSVALAGS